MSDYSKSFNGAAKDAAQSIVYGSDFDSEFNLIATAVATKANKAAPVLAGNVATLSSTGDLQDGSVTATELAILDGATLTTAEINYLDLTTGPGTQEASKAVVADANVNTGVSKVTQLWIGASGSEVQVNSTPAELNILNGATATTTEVNYLSGLTSNIQTQLNAKAETTSDVLTLTAGATIGAVGTYAMLATITIGSYSPGDTASGTSLRYWGSGGVSGTAPSGTWMCMGYIAAQNDATLWLRTV